MQYNHIVVEIDGPCGIITLDRPEALNALSSPMMDELANILGDFENNDEIAVIIITGGDKAFAAGADIKEMKDKTFAEAYGEDFISRNWERVCSCRKPVIAGVAGYALGGGCELAMMCDFIIAADNARFGQPEINLGIIPGAGGTQRLTRLVGKSKAMDMCLTGRMMDAEEAERSGLVSRIVPLADLKDKLLEIGKTIAALSRPSTLLAKEAVNQAYESTLKEGIHFERRMFHALFATEDQKEGMAAFADKRSPNWRHR